MLAALNSRRWFLQGPHMQHADADPQMLGTACMAVKHASLRSCKLQETALAAACGFWGHCRVRQGFDWDFGCSTGACAGLHAAELHYGIM